MISDYCNAEVIGNMKTAISLPDISDRNFWDGLSKDLKNALVSEGEKRKNEAWPVIMLSDYRRFYEDGDRVSYEDKCFLRRKKLSAMVMAECVLNDGTFIKEILDGLYLIMEESSWCHPAHNSHIRDAKQTNMPDITNPVIDLFAAETGAVIGVAEYLLRPVLSGISPLITVHTDHAIRERLIVPFLNEHFWWMGDDENKAINWTVWIVQNILLSAFTRSEDAITAEERAGIIGQAVESTDYFIDSYGEDGCCDEGAQYYSHAGLCLYGILDILNDIADGIFEDVFKKNKIRNIANYIRKIYVDDGYYINFADCAAKAGPRSAREFCFGKACGDNGLCSMAADDYRIGDWNIRLLTEENNLWYRLIQAMTHEEMMRYRHVDSEPESDVFFESTGMMISRNNTFVLAAKAGNNADSHNHNDVGSVTLYKEGNPLLIDLGVETYTARTFSDKRYEIWTMQSVYHNLPTFYDGHETIMERAGAKYAAKDVVFDADEHSLSMDIAPAFGNKHIVSYKRKVRLAEDRVIIDDFYDGDFDGVLGFMTYEEPSVSDKSGDEGDEINVRIGGLGRLVIRENSIKAADISIEKCAITDERLKISWKHDCYRIRIPFRRGNIRVEIV